MVDFVGAWTEEGRCSRVFRRVQTLPSLAKKDATSLVFGFPPNKDLVSNTYTQPHMKRSHVSSALRSTRENFHMRLRIMIYLSERGAYLVGSDKEGVVSP